MSDTFCIDNNVMSLTFLTVADDVVDMTTGEIIATADTEISEEIFRFGLVSILEIYSPIDTSTGGVKYSSFFKTIDKFSQIFLNVTGTMETPTEEFSISYNFINKSVKEIDYTKKNIDSDGYLQTSEHYEYSIN